MVVAEHLTLAQVEHVITELESKRIEYVLERADCGCWTIVSFTNPLGAMIYRAYGLYPDN